MQIYWMQMDLLPQLDFFKLQINLYHYATKIQHASQKTSVHLMCQLIASIIQALFCFF